MRERINTNSSYPDIENPPIHSIILAIFNEFLGDFVMNQNKMVHNFVIEGISAGVFKVFLQINFLKA